MSHKTLKELATLTAQKQTQPDSVGPVSRITGRNPQGITEAWTYYGVTPAIAAERARTDDGLTHVTARPAFWDGAEWV